MTDRTNAERQRRWRERQRQGGAYRPMLCEICGAAHHGRHGRHHLTPQPMSYLRSWRVTTTAGTVTVLARCRADATTAGLELTGASAVLTVLERSDW